MKPQDNEIRQLLQEWRDVPESDGDLCRKVLACCTDESAQPQQGVIAHFLASLGLGLHPVRAAAWCILGGVLMGAGIAEYQASQRRQELAAEMPSRYLTQIDPTRTFAVADRR